MDAVLDVGTLGTLGSVFGWLRTLRLHAEPYDGVSDFCECCCIYCCADEWRTLNRNKTIREEEEEVIGEKTETEEKEEGTEDEAVIEVEESMASVSRKAHELLEIKFGQECRVSTLFDDGAEFLPLSPIIFHTIDWNWAGPDVMLWKESLRHSYCCEDDLPLESQELIKNVETLEEDREKNSAGRPPNFPVVVGDAQEVDVIPKVVVDDVAVEVRKRPEPSRPVRSKTFNFDLSPKSTTRRTQLTFEVKGASKVQVGNEICAKVRASERLKFTATGDVLLIAANGKTRTLKTGVELKPGSRLVSKRDVELKDVFDGVILLQFDSARDAKQFVDSEKARFASGEKISIKWKLLRLLGKRSSRDLLESKGILQNEPIFGNTLQNVFELSAGIPAFITRVIELIELPCNIASVGLYRTSGNLAIIQKIRFEIDCGKLDILHEYERDVDVLTGALKLFFRELKEPLIPFEVCQELLEVMDGPSDDEETEKVLDDLPQANHEILVYLLHHLVRVCDRKEDNKMDLYNMSVCWGPCLIGIPDACTDIVMQAVNVSKVTEYLLRHHQRRRASSTGIVGNSLPNSLPNSSPKLSVTNMPKIDHNQNQPVSVEHQTVQKLVDLIEYNLTVGGIHKKTGSSAKIDKILKKLEKNKIEDLDKFKNDILELSSALRKYVTTLPEPLLPKWIFEQFCIDCDTLGEFSVATRQHLHSSVETLPNSKRDTLILLLRHLLKVCKCEKDNHTSRADLVTIWAPVLAERGRKLFGEKFIDALLTNVESRDVALPDLLQEQLRIRARESRYDNVPDISDVRGEANLLEDDDKTDLTRF